MLRGLIGPINVNYLLCPQRLKLGGTMLVLEQLNIHIVSLLRLAICLQSHS